MTIKIPREGLADALEHIAQHARKFVIDGLSVHFDGSMYRISFEGEGEFMPEHQAVTEEP